MNRCDEVRKQQAREQREAQHAEHTTGWEGVGQPLLPRCSATFNMAAMAAVTVQARPAATLQRAAPSARALFCQARPAPRSSFSSRLQVAAVAGEGNACTQRVQPNMQGCAAPRLPPSPHTRTVSRLTGPTSRALVPPAGGPPPAPLPPPTALHPCSPSSPRGGVCGSRQARAQLQRRGGDLRGGGDWRAPADC